MLGISWVPRIQSTWPGVPVSWPEAFDPGSRLDVKCSKCSMFGVRSGVRTRVQSKEAGSRFAARFSQFCNLKSQIRSVASPLAALPTQLAQRHRRHAKRLVVTTSVDIELCIEEIHIDTSRAGKEVLIR
jgi:hypothetical protein